VRRCMLSRRAGRIGLGHDQFSKRHGTLQM
jgi:hypothetical protein